MIDFIKHLIIVFGQRYGSFVWFGTHLSLTQTDWHYILETFLSIFVNFFIIFSLYLEWKQKKDEDISKTTDT
jgi:hypothetical protein